jgi:hypothetical protein
MHRESIIIIKHISNDTIVAGSRVVFRKKDSLVITSIPCDIIPQKFNTEDNGIPISTNLYLVICDLTYKDIVKRGCYVDYDGETYIVTNTPKRFVSSVLPHIEFFIMEHING